MGLFSRKKEDGIPVKNKPAPDGFTLKAHPIEANYLFMDIHKKDLNEHLDEMKKNADNLIASHREHSAKVQEMFRDIPKEHAFWLKSGESLKNLQELYDALHDMDDIIYFHHVNPEKNDFADWVRHMFKDDKLASALSASTSREEAAKAIEKRIKEIKMQILGDAAFGDSQKKKPDDDKKEKKPKNKRKKKFLGLFGKVEEEVEQEDKELQMEIERRKRWLSMKQAEIERKEHENFKKERELYEKYKELQQKEHELDQHIGSDDTDTKGFEPKESDDKPFFSEKTKKKKKADEKKLNIKSDMEDITQKKYENMERLLLLLSENIKGKKFSEARKVLPLIKKYYDSLDQNDPRKHDFYYKIMQLKSSIDEALGTR